MISEAISAFSGSDTFRDMDMVHRIKDKKTGETIGAMFIKSKEQTNICVKFLNMLKNTFKNLRLR
ncbi:hypothetical protein J6E39_01540 [bacterium]|nr:hypothetical protein [bacterium]